MNKILEAISNEKRIAISGHVRPDGDCFGSTMSLYYYLMDAFPEKEIDLYLESVPGSFAFLPLSDTIKTKEKMEGKLESLPSYDLFFSLDCGSSDRLGFVEELFEKAQKTICIDHHISNTSFGDINQVEPNASSTCEVLYGLFEEEKITEKIAAALYLGIVHDTGVFKHSCTSRKTLEIAGKLIEKGIPFSKIIDETFFEKTYVQNQLLGRCLLESLRLLDGRIIATHIEQNTLKFYGAGSEDLDGIVDQLRITKGVEVAIFAHETAPQEYKVSMRANGDVDVSRVARYFGGGGHVKAAGCTMRGSYRDVFNNLTAQIVEQM